MDMSDTPQIIEPQILSAEDAEALRAELEAARGRSRSLESENSSLRQRESEAQKQARVAATGQLSEMERSNDASLAAIEGEIQNYRSRIAALNAEGNFEEAASMTEKLGDATARRREEQGRKAWIAQQKNAPPPAEPTEDILPAERQWIAANPAYNTDPALRERINAAFHYATKVRGLTRGSKELFESIEHDVWPERSRQQPRQQQQQPSPEPVITQPLQQAPTADELQTQDGKTVVVQERQSSNMPASPIGDIMPQSPQERVAPQQPQQRAAGPGGMNIASAAAAPSRRISVPQGARIDPQRPHITPEQMDTAMDLARSLAPEIYRKGAGDVAVWYLTHNEGPRARELRERWSAGG